MWIWGLSVSINKDYDKEDEIIKLNQHLRLF